MLMVLWVFVVNPVALHPEGVDRNATIQTMCKLDLVALHPEGVDRNFLLVRLVGNVRAVALHPEGVDRNRQVRSACMVICRRPPPGGRG